MEVSNCLDVVSDLVSCTIFILSSVVICFFELVSDIIFCSVVMLLPTGVFEKICDHEKMGRQTNRVSPILRRNNVERNKYKGLK